MMRNHYPDRVQRQLDKWEQAVTYWTGQVSKTEGAIASARERLTGGFEKDAEYHDLRKVLDRLVQNDQPEARWKLNATQSILSKCQGWLKALPDGTVLEPVTVAKPNGLDLAHVQRRIEDSEEEINKLRSVPVPGTDIKTRVEDYARSLARPKISGIASGEQLQVQWPENSALAAWALAFRDKMVNGMLEEIEREANLPMPLPQRQQRIAELTAEIDTLRWQARALGDTALPPAYLLGVRVARREPAKRVSAA